MNNDYIEIKEASQILHVNVNSLYRMVLDNRVPYYKPFKKILFKKEELLQFIEKFRIPASDEIKKLAVNQALTEKVNFHAKNH